MSNTLSYDYTYDTYKRAKKAEMRYENSKLFGNVLKQFQQMRKDIFDLRYAAEQVNTDMISGKDSNELNMILPVIVKLAEAVEFISTRELAEWKRKVDEEVKIRKIIA